MCLYCGSSTEFIKGSVLHARSVPHSSSLPKGLGLRRRAARQWLQPMAHLERRSTPEREGQIALLTGAIYGVAHTLSGHPLDNLKARLQLDRSLHGSSAPAAARHLWRTEGLIAFFRGCGPPLWGSAVYRAVMMSSYELSFTYLEAFPDEHLVKGEHFGCVRPVVVFSAIFCALCRTVVEAPIEQAKVTYQLGRPLAESGRLSEERRHSFELAGRPTI